MLICFNRYEAHYGLPLGRKKSAKAVSTLYIAEDYKRLESIVAGENCFLFFYPKEARVQAFFSVYKLNQCIPYLLVYKSNSCISRPPIFKVKNRIFHHFWLKK